MSSLTKNFIRHNEIKQAPVVKLGQPASAVLRRLRRGDQITSFNGSDWHCGPIPFTEQCIDSLLESGLVQAVQCGPDVLLALHLELTDIFWQTKHLLHDNPFAGTDYAPVYDAMHALARYAIRELSGDEQRNALDAIDHAMHYSSPADKLTALRALRDEIGMVA